MAWGAADVWFSSIEDAIKYWHYNFGRLFVGAAGSTGVCVDYLLRNNTFFPAEIPEVIAVTGVDDDGKLACNVMHGPGVDLAAHVDQVTTGRYSDVVTIMASSNAAGVVGGMAALVWNRYPTMSRDQVRQRLESMASYGLSGNKDGDIGYGIVNAYRAVGGFYDLRIDGPTCLGAYEADEVTLTAMPYGDGPFTYKWHDGQTGKSATFPAPAPGETAEYLVYVTDGLEGKMRSRAHYVEKLPTTDTRLMC